MWHGTEKLSTGRGEATKYGPLQSLHRINVPSSCSSYLHVLARALTWISLVEKKIGHEEMYKEAHGQMWGMSRCLSPGIKPLTHLCKGPARFRTLGLGLDEFLHHDTTTAPERAWILSLNAAWKGHRTFQVWQQCYLHSSKEKWRVEEKILPCSQSSPHIRTLSLLTRISSTFISSWMAFPLER